MAIKEILLDSILHELRLCTHLYSKIPAGTSEFRPAPNMRSTLELLQYLGWIGKGSIDVYLHSSTREENLARYRRHIEEAKTLAFDDFPAAFESQAEEIVRALAPLTEEDLATRMVLQPWGESVTLLNALLNSTVKYLAAYRHQLFLYAKQCGAEIGTANNWRGVDARPVPKPNPEPQPL